MAFRDWLNRLPLPYERLTGKRGSWPWIAALAAVAFLFLVAWSGSLGAVADLVRALAALCWPALVYVVLRTYQEEIRSLLHRIRRTKPSSGELELRADVDQLEQQVRAEFERMPTIPVARADRHNDDAGAKDASEERRVLDAAARSPRLGLMELSLATEQELRRLLAAAGGETSLSPDGNAIGGLARRLVEVDLMPRSLANCLAALADLRDRLVHAHAAHENEAMRAIDLGIRVLRIVRSLGTQADGGPPRRLAERGMEEVVRGV
ncbi:MAG TPA: hypothetical protein VG826_32775 [Pirellulales bacterium]|nr:hypothetical protein [Pirellulales bacterium]